MLTETSASYSFGTGNPSPTTDIKRESLTSSQTVSSGTSIKLNLAFPFNSSFNQENFISHTASFTSSSKKEGEIVSSALRKKDSLSPARKGKADSPRSSVSPLRKSSSPFRDETSSGTGNNTSNSPKEVSTFRKKSPVKDDKSLRSDSSSSITKKQSVANSSSTQSTKSFFASTISSEAKVS